MIEYEYGSSSRSLFPSQIGVWRVDWRKEHEEKYPLQRKMSASETFNFSTFK